MTRGIVAICNPISGRRSSLPAVRRIAAELRQRGWEMDIFCTEAPGHATALAAAIPADTHAVVVAGGDGTTYEVVNGLPDKKIPLALLPAGTENLLGRSFHLPADARQAAQLLIHGAAIERDAGEVNGRLFLAVGGIGFDAECVRKLYQRRRGYITHLDYVIPIGRTFCEYQHPHLHVTIDGKPVFEGRSVVVFGLMSRYAAGLSVLPDATGFDGSLHVAVFPCHSRRTLLGHAWRVLLRNHFKKTSVIYRRAANMVCAYKKPVWIEMDGEPFLTERFEARIRPKQIRLLSPSADRTDACNHG